jgi:ribonuclease HI
VQRYSDIKRVGAPHADNVFKINTDGAFNPNTHFGGVGALARDHHGKCLKGMASWLPYMQSALVAEAEACRMVLKVMSNEVGIKVVVETDSKELVDLWKVRDQDRSEIANDPSRHSRAHA